MAKQMLEKPVAEIKNEALWQERANKEQSVLGAAIMRGTVSMEEARRLQRERTKHLPADGFDTNWAVGYYHKTGGLVYKDEQLMVGETVESIFQRKAEYVQFDRTQEESK